MFQNSRDVRLVYSSPTNVLGSVKVSIRNETKQTLRYNSMLNKCFKLVEYVVDTSFRFCNCCSCFNTSVLSACSIQFNLQHNQHPSIVALLKIVVNKFESCLTRLFQHLQCCRGAYTRCCISAYGWTPFLPSDHARKVRVYGQDIAKARGFKESFRGRLFWLAAKCTPKMLLQLNCHSSHTLLYRSCKTTVPVQPTSVGQNYARLGLLRQELELLLRQYHRTDQDSEPVNRQKITIVQHSLLGLLGSNSARC